MHATAPASGKQIPEPSEVTHVAVDENAELREEAIASLRRKRRVVENAIGYITVNGVLWLIWALTDRSSDGGMPWPAWVSAIWGFFLVQSCFFLVAGVRERRADGGHPDPFEAAHARAMEVLERPIRSAA